MPLKNFTLLFIEDDADTQEHIKMLLEDDLKEIYQAYDGREGLELYKQKSPDIVLTDINIPYLNGLELATQIKAIKQQQPIIMISAFDDKENLMSSINIGSDGFIAKPIDVDLLFSRLNAVAQELEHKSIEVQKTEDTIDTLYNLAHFDSLTALANRTMFDKELSSYIDIAKNENREFAIFFIDLDNFKAINDNYGHEAGDHVLQVISKNISQALSKEDVFARRSGDEFFILVKNYTTKIDLQRIASDILSYSAKSIIWNQEFIKLSCSIGISEFPKDSDNKKELMVLADIAMYNAKNSGKCKYFFAHNNNTYNIHQNDNQIIYITHDFFWHKKHTQLIYKNKDIVLTKNELLFLSLLFTAVNYQFTYEQIYKYVWGDEFLDKKESLKTLVKLLRKKLPQNIIVNIFNVGYIIELNR
jgi:diguanylate cyclase (GGDEF)-like protein